MFATGVSLIARIAALARRKRRDTASEGRRIRVVGRFASPHSSREGSPDDTPYDSSDSDNPYPAVLNSPIHVHIAKEDPNDADDEADAAQEMKLRGRSREVRQISVSRR